MGTCVSLLAGAGISRFPGSDEAKAASASEWLAMREDPVRRKIAGTPDLDTILRLFPRTTGEPAFDPALILGEDWP